MEFTVMHKDDLVAIARLSEDKKKMKMKKLIPDCIRQPICGNKLDLERVWLLQLSILKEHPWS